jgi:hypothetical protein
VTRRSDAMNRHGLATHVGTMDQLPRASTTPTSTNEMMLASEMHHEPRFSDFMDIEMTSLFAELVLLIVALAPIILRIRKGENDVGLTELNLNH